MILIVEADVDQIVHGVLVAADHGSGDSGQREKPGGVDGANVERACPDGLLVEENSFWCSDEVDGLGGGGGQE